MVSRWGKRPSVAGAFTIKGYLLQPNLRSEHGGINVTEDIQAADQQLPSNLASLEVSDKQTFARMW